MEGSGEGVVAIVRGSKHALTVTLLTNSRRVSKRKYADASQRSTRVSYSSVETNTERNFENVSAPVYGIRYASNYRLQDYHRSAFATAAFPQQTSCALKCKDPFAESLRKYPTDTSAELIQRIINYSASKNCARRRYSRNLRLLLRKSRSQQTHRRTEFENGLDAPEEHSNNALSSSSVQNKHLSQKELVNYTYDYLNSSSAVPRNTDVRYFTEVNRAIRERLKGFIDNKPAVCPWIQKRYNRHKSHFHGKNTKAETTLISKGFDIQDKKKNNVRSHGTAPVESSGMPALRHTASSNVISCYTRRKSCFCYRPFVCGCDKKINRHEQIQNLLSNFDLESDQTDNLISIKNLFNEPNVQDPGDFTREDDNDSKNPKFVKVINDWLETIPVYANFNIKDKVRREKIAKELTKNLINLQKHLNFLFLAKKEILKYLNVLPIWRPGDSNNEVILIEQIADDLIKRLIDLSQNNFNTAISEIVKELPFDSKKVNDGVIREIINTCINKLTPIALNRPKDDEHYKANLKLEIINILEDLPLETDKQKSDQIFELTNKFAEQLYHYNVFKTENQHINVDRINEEIENKIFDWCMEIPEFSKCSTSQFSDLIQLLAKKLYSFNSQNVKDDKFRRILQKEIKEWLDTISIRINKNFNLKRKNILSNNLIQRLFGAEHMLVMNNSFNGDNITTKCFQHIIEWFQNIPELSKDNKNEMDTALINLAFQLNEVITRENDLENILANMKETISNWLQLMLRNKSIDLDSKTQDNLVNDLIVKMKDLRRKESENSDNLEFNNDVITWVTEISYLKPFSDQNNVVENFIARLKDIKNKNNITENDIEEEVKSFVHQLSENIGKSVTQEDINKLKLKIITRMKLSLSPKMSWNKKKILKYTLLEKISTIVDSCPLITKEQKEFVKCNITDVILKNLTDHTFDVNQTISQIISILTQNTALSMNDIEILGNKITASANNVLVNYEFMNIPSISSKDSADFTAMETDISKDLNDKITNQNTDFEEQKSSNQHQGISEMHMMNYNNEHESNFKGNEENTFEECCSDFKVISTIKSNEPPALKSNMQAINSQVKYYANKSIHNDLETKDTDKNDNKGNSILTDIDKAFKIFDKKLQERKIVNGTLVKSTSSIKRVNNNTQIETKVRKRNEKKYLEKDFTTSTPLATTVHYVPSGSSVELLSIFNSSHITKKKSNNEEFSKLLQYLNKIKSVVNKWLSHFILNIDEQIKYDLVRNIARDVLDRQKYLQLSGKTTCEKDELEHLKYQMFKRTYDFDNHETLHNIMSNIDCLYNRIVSIEVPKLTQQSHTDKPNEKIDSHVVYENIESLEHKITIWFNKFSPKFMNSLNENNHEEIIQQLVRNLESLRMNDHYDSVHVKEEILQWLSNIINNIDRRKLSGLAENLKIYLNDAGLTETYIPMQNTSEFVVENFTGAIIEWFRISPYRYTLQNQMVNYFVLSLANDIKEVFANLSILSSDELNRLLIQEIVKNLTKTTADLDNSVFYHEVACDLLNYLKHIKLFHNISDRKEVNENRESKIIKYKDEIKKAIINWFKGLSLEKGTKFQDFEDIINDFTQTVLQYYIFDDILSIENRLKEYIITLLHKIPLKMDKQGYHDIELQAATLIAIIKDIFIPKQPMISKLIQDSETYINEDQDKLPNVMYKKLLHDTISKTLFEKMTSEEQVSFILLKEKLADAFINLHYLIDDKEMHINFKNKLYKEISKFCDNYKKLRHVLYVDTDQLQKELHKILQNVSSPTITSKAEVNQDKLRDEISKWVSNIPVDKSIEEENNISEMIFNLTERLQFILNKSELNNGNEDEIKHELEKWLKNIHWKREILSTEEIVNILIKRLKIQFNKFDKRISSVKECKDESKMIGRKDNETQYTFQFPSSTLSIDDIDHLKRIRARSDVLSKSESVVRNKPNKYILTNPDAEIGIQTDVNDKIARSVQTSNTSMIEKITTNKEILPQVIVKEYYWDSNGSQQSFQLSRPQMISPQITVLPNPIFTTSRSQTELNSNYEIKSQAQLSKVQTIQESRIGEASRTKDAEIQSTECIEQRTDTKKHSIHESSSDKICEAPNIITSVDSNKQQDEINENKRKSERSRGYSLNKENEEINHLQSSHNSLVISREPRNEKISEKLSPVLITKNKSERRIHVSPECIHTRKSREDKICCNCKNRMLTKCRNKPYSGCRQIASTLKHCSKCYGGDCPHPSYFYFRKEF